MSNAINRVTIGGNLGATPELKFTAGGFCVLKLRVATNEAHYDKDKKLVTRTDWHDVVLFGPRAEGLARILDKGDAVVVDGTLRTSVYERDGKSIKHTEVVARELMLAGRKPRNGGEVEVEEEDPFAPASDGPPLSKRNHEPQAALA